MKQVFLSGAIDRRLRGGESTCSDQAKGTKCDLWLVPLHYILSLYISSHVVSYEPAPWSPNLRTPSPRPPLLLSIAVWLWLPLPPFPLGPPPSCFGGCAVTCDPGRGGRKAAECQRDAAAMCEGRRGGSSDLSEWRRPAREMYTLPLLLLLYSYIVTFLPISSSTEHTHTHLRARGHDVDHFDC